MRVSCLLTGLLVGYVGLSLGCGRFNFAAVSNDDGGDSGGHDALDGDAKLVDASRTPDGNPNSELPCGSVVEVVTLTATGNAPTHSISAIATDRGIAIATNLDGVVQASSIGISQSAVGAVTNLSGIFSNAGTTSIAYSDGNVMIAAARSTIIPTSNLRLMKSDFTQPSFGTTPVRLNSERALLGLADSTFAVIGVSNDSTVHVTLNGVDTQTVPRDVVTRVMGSASLNSGPQGPFATVVDAASNQCKILPADAGLTTFATFLETDSIGDCSNPRAVGTQTGARLVAVDLVGFEMTANATFTANARSSTFEPKLTFGTPSTTPRIAFDGVNYWMTTTVESAVNDLTRVYRAKPDQAIADIQLSTHLNATPELVVRNGAAYVIYLEHSPSPDKRLRMIRLCEP
jgi:hypothetical protein